MQLAFSGVLRLDLTILDEAMFLPVAGAFSGGASPYRLSNLDRSCCNTSRSEPSTRWAAGTTGLKLIAPER